jgi:phosphoglycolate phosphatase-like HAD superfamily hydrolase
MDMDRKIIIFDIDGTLSNCEHRRQFVRTEPPNWNAFNGACHADEPHFDILWLNHLMANDDAFIIVASGRSDEFREETLQWLNEHGVIFEELCMRRKGDSRQDNIVKKEILDGIRLRYGEPYMAIDDRQQVVDFWRKEGVRCLQCAPGDF